MEVINSDSNENDGNHAAHPNFNGFESIVIFSQRAQGKCNKPGEDDHWNTGGYGKNYGQVQTRSATNGHRDEHSEI